jgi:tripartite-type tricarboxylate transporter receptor subunit TctC
MRKIIASVAASIVLCRATRPQGTIQRRTSGSSPFAAGSATDTLARLLATTSRPRRSVVVENIAGGNGIPARKPRALPDGYTVMITANTTHAETVFLKSCLTMPSPILSP